MTVHLTKARTEELTSSEIELALRELEALDPRAGRPLAIIGYRRWSGAYALIEYQDYPNSKHEGRMIEDALVAAHDDIVRAMQVAP